MGEENNSRSIGHHGSNVTSFSQLVNDNETTEKLHSFYAWCVIWLTSLRLAKRKMKDIRDRRGVNKLYWLMHVWKRKACLPKSSSFTSFAAFSPSSRRLLSMILDLSAAALSSWLTVQPMVPSARFRAPDVCDRIEETGVWGHWRLNVRQWYNTFFFFFKSKARLVNCNFLFHWKYFKFTNEPI